MNIRDAILRMVTGAHTSRLAWVQPGQCIFTPIIRIGKLPPASDNMYLIRSVGSEDFHWVPRIDDLIADDWYVVPYGTKIEKED